ncbi:thioredoxin 2 [Mactra antiquata]
MAKRWMASRTVFRRLLQANRRAFLHRPTVIRSVTAAHQIQPSNTTSFHTSIRSLSNKTGDGMIINIQNVDDFEERVVNSSVPVIVDFHANWCGPCKLLGPRLESLVGNREGKVILAKIDVDEQDELAMKFMINSVPTVIGFKDKKEKDKFIGLKDDEVLEEFIDRLIE